MNPPGITWRKSTYSSGSSNNCVEVALAAPDVLAIRDSKNPDGPNLTIFVREWHEFIDRVKSGEFDGRRDRAGYLHSVRNR